jgi:hypothetical protein
MQTLWDLCSRKLGTGNTADTLRLANFRLGYHPLSKLGLPRERGTMRISRGSLQALNRTTEPRMRDSIEQEIRSTTP